MSRVGLSRVCLSRVGYGTKRERERGWSERESEKKRNRKKREIESV